VYEGFKLNLGNGDEMISFYSHSWLEPEIKQPFPSLTCKNIPDTHGINQKVSLIKFK